jgi:uncharacterized protein YjbI with pentapeptide repeats
MANEEHLAILKQGVGVWNKWRKDNPNARPDLKETSLVNADLSGADLHSADFSNSYLCGTDFHFSNLIEARFFRANLKEADLHGANLYKACLSEAYLAKTNMRESNLSGADLSNAAMYYVDLRESILARTDLRRTNVKSLEFISVDLAEVIGLETLQHYGPSMIDIGTIYRSNGKIPDEFLIGAGVPDDMISYIHSIAGAIRFYSCFISYSSKDKEFAERLYADLQAKAVRCWYAPHDVQVSMGAIIDGFGPEINQVN